MTAGGQGACMPGTGTPLGSNRRLLTAALLGWVGRPAIRGTELKGLQN
jgi:hypothetical protein